LELAIEGAGEIDQAELAHCHSMLARNLRLFGDLDGAHEHATASVNMWRRLDDEGVGLSQALNTLAFIEWERGKPIEARRLYEAAIALDRKYDHKAQLRVDLGDFAILEGWERNYQRSMELDAEALAIAREFEDPFAVLFQQHNMACTLRVTGRVEEANEQLHELIPLILQIDDAAFLMILAEDYAAVHAELGTYTTAAYLLGAADAMHERLGILRDPMQEEEIAESIARAKSRLSTAEWDDAYEAGRSTPVEEALTQARAAGADRSHTANDSF
jgi:tetratricopeptide (TPR) repeat protein